MRGQALVDSTGIRASHQFFSLASPAFCSSLAQEQSKLPTWSARLLYDLRSLHIDAADTRAVIVNCSCHAADGLRSCTSRPPPPTRPSRRGGASGVRVPCVACLVETARSSCSSACAEQRGAATSQRLTVRLSEGKADTSREANAWRAPQSATVQSPHAALLLLALLPKCALPLQLSTLARLADLLQVRRPPPKARAECLVGSAAECLADELMGRKSCSRAQGCSGANLRLLSEKIPASDLLFGTWTLVQGAELLRLELSQNLTAAFWAVRPFRRRC
eukprot:6205159-Pleurochrysis_carterae.AAC.5